ncbi:uncharacterized protein BKA55DRAFT_695745 [Fusarium redolens]|uniref:Ribonuclease H1 N-terminal domain-containing protein n=1 Tax=Fusarium redolens TaxID=48865 RepID=A0A9P9G5C4_FUSRE|nr:uncharacterized protein BKA55DRAFT_695745 [Fusarium redolens]KAH7232325.1 hypothetical protein BKA55DRAFT_695745 [Fusarium redolens]
MDVKVYAISEGREPGYYFSWPEVQERTKGYSEPRFKKFKSLQEAQDWYNDPIQCTSRTRRQRKEIDNERVRRHMRFLNRSIALKTARGVKISESDSNAIIEGFAALKIEKAMTVTRSYTGFDFQPSTSPSSSSPSSPSSPSSSPSSSSSTVNSLPPTTPSPSRFRCISSPASGSGSGSAITSGYGSQDGPFLLGDEGDF